MVRATVIALLSVLLPILLIEIPTISSSMGSIKGTYDVLMVAVALPRAQVFQLIPRSIQQGVSANDTLLEVPEDVYDIADPELTLDRAAHHVVLLQMGYQISTGPGPSWVPKFSFNELKMDIPFVKHPSGKSDKPMVYKQTMVFSNSVIKMGSSGTGLTSKTARFSPEAAPYHFAEDSQTIEYKAEGFVDAYAKKVDSSTDQDKSLKVYRDLTQEWWFGVGTGEKVQRFEFQYDRADIRPTPYEVNVELDLRGFAVNEASPQQDDTNTQAVVSLHGFGWRSRVPFSSTASTVKSI